MEEGLSVDVVDFDDCIVLYLVVCEGYLNVVEFLIKKGVDVNCVDWWGSMVCFVFFVFVYKFFCSVSELVFNFFLIIIG